MKTKSTRQPEMAPKTACVPVIHDHLPLLEAVDVAALEHLLADAAVSGCIVARLSPTVAVLDPAKVETVIARLKKLGQWPKVV